MTVDELKNLKEIVNQAMTEVSTKLKKDISETERRTEGLILNARKETLIDNWLDAFKYGIATSICIVPIYLLIKFIASLIGFNLP